MPLDSGHKLSHYRLTEKIGEGGMGVVWKARDQVLGRTVAIKVLTAEAARDESRRRMFLEEARLASSLSDAHIAQVHELGRQDDLDFIVMEYVPGVPLDESLQGRPLPPDRVAALGEQVARALARAHRRNLLHRDIKPGNILVTAEGEAKVVDFGLATLFEHERTDTLTDLSTRTIDEGEPPSRIMGTLPYMSPEQLRRERLDARSDIFSLGTVLYEMTAGRRPFAAASNLALAEEIRKARPRPLRELVPGIPVELDRIVQKALAPRAADRYQTMEDLAVDLRRLGRDLETGSAPSYGELEVAALTARRGRRLWLALAALALVLALVVGGRAFRSWRAGAGRGDTAVLVLPVEVRGSTDGDDYIGRGFAESMALSLAQSEGLRVLPVPADGEWNGLSETARAEEARALGAQVVIRGSLTIGEKTADASLTGVRAEDSRILWGVQQTLGRDDLSALSANLVQDIRGRLGATPRRVFGWKPWGSPEFLASPELAEVMKEGGFSEEKDPEALGALIERFPDETFPRYLKTATLWFRSKSVIGASPERRAFEASLRDLVTLDPNGPWEDYFQAKLAWWEGRWPEMIAGCSRVLARDDLAPEARVELLQLLAVARGGMGQMSAALAALRESLRVEPLRPVWSSNLGNALTAMGRYAEALTYFQRAVVLGPDEPYAHNGFGVVLERTGRQDEALVEYEKACELSGTSTGCSNYDLLLVRRGRFSEALPPLQAACEENRSDCGAYAVALQIAGRPEEARAAARKAAAPPESRDSLYDLADYYALAGNDREAIRCLRRHLDFHGPNIGIAEDPDLVSLHGEPEFEALVAEVRERIGS